jgi:phosphoglycerate dehydrogenase-like enzyme
MQTGVLIALHSAHARGAALDACGNIPPKPSPTGGRPRRPFHEPPNVLVTPHCSSSCDATAERRWSAVTGNLDRFARGEALENVVSRT